MSTINWSNDKEDGNFKPEINEAMDLMWWAKQVRIGRQLQGSDIDIRNKLLQLPTNKKIVNGQMNGKFKTMFLGVEANNYCLYRDVTTQVNDSIMLAMSESRQMILDYHLKDSLTSFLRQIFPLVENEFPNLSENLPLGFKAFIAVMLTFTKNPSIMIEGTLITISEFLKKNIISYFWNFLYEGQWGQNIKHYGKWDFKRNKAPFNAVKEGANISPFFYYKGHGTTYNLFMPGCKSGLLRHDDPGNMCYGATGKIMLSGYIKELSHFEVLEAAAHAYSGKVALQKAWATFKSELVTMIKNEGIRSMSKVDDLCKDALAELRSKMADDPRDLKAVEYGFNNF